MAQTPSKEDQQAQHSAMFEAMAQTNFEYDEICRLVSKNGLSSPSSSSAPAGSDDKAQDASGDSVTSNPHDVPYSDQQSQNSAMFEAMASTNFEYDEICGLVSSQHQLSSSPPPSSSPPEDRNDNSTSSGGANDSATTDTNDVPYSERAIEGDKDYDNDTSALVEKSWWRLGLRWTGWGSRPVVYEYVPQ
ncbi:hypothetical protein PG987_013396 [Apiospora arundinis]|uniref:Uncharacterized protein n=1 Tax=Apiospora arundinis TaxID=335852 RepID=A0ABR2IHT7_9PEZI